MSPAEAWFITPREAFWYVRAAAWRNTETFQLAMRTAYYSGAIARSGGKLPSFSEMFPDPNAQPERPKSPEELLAWWEGWAATVNAAHSAKQGG